MPGLALWTAVRLQGRVVAVCLVRRVEPLVLLFLRRLVRLLVLVCP